MGARKMNPHGPVDRTTSEPALGPKPVAIRSSEATARRRATTVGRVLLGSVFFAFVFVGE